MSWMLLFLGLVVNYWEKWLWCEKCWCSLYHEIFKPSKLQINADFHLFKTGVEPKWEDPECANGGKWTVTSNIGRKTNLENMWLETVIFYFILSPIVFVFGFEKCGEIWCLIVIGLLNSWWRWLGSNLRMLRTYAVWLLACASGKTNFHCGQRQRQMRLPRFVIFL